MLQTVSERISAGARRAQRAVNQELIVTYWAIGHDILGKQLQEGWGTKVIDRLASDLRVRFPDVRGFSPRNLKYMRTFAAAWPDPAIVQQSVAQLPWGQNIVLLDKLNDSEIRLWYAKKAVEEGWSRKTLITQIDSRLFERSGRAITNFKSTLSLRDSKHSQEATKDPYIFDFLNFADLATERDLENQLIEHVERFLLELGRGFAFVGRQMRLDISGDEVFPDLLFYNFKLRRFVVIELKTGKFEPGYLGQLGMCMSAVDDLLAQPDDEPTIGLLMCKSKNKIVAEYALRGFQSPIGVAEWATELE
ncbi:PDDEXK nuclease domain-containing protein [Enteractinococcus helveticum]|uniref:PDDEXK nuclease domain-containing protein n=1 Tax=Enteractinococcus helveticum TaxID=1837282 RepID=UPI000AB76E1F|nr:PDDEXK nuclease domain-containing protein [Enteractinococcus helveticum]